MTPADPPSSPESRVAYLDCLRGLAAVSVVLAHIVRNLLLPYNTLPNGEWLQQLVYHSPFYLFIHSAISVKLFFMISGFSLSYPILMNHGSHKIRQMALYRIFRLGVPMIFSALLIYAFLKMELYSTNEAFALVKQRWLLRLSNFEPNLTDAVFGTIIRFLLGIQSDFPRYNNVFWTMPIEFVASMSLFALQFMFARQALWIRSLVYLLLTILLWKSLYLGFVLGAALCDWTIHRQPQERLKRLLGPTALSGIEIAIIALFLAFFSALRLFPRFGSILEYHILDGNVLEYLLALTILVVASLRNHLHAWITTPFIRYLGKISFSLYLVHIPILASFSCWLFVTLHAWIGNPIVIALLVLTTSLPLIVLVSHLFHHLVEVRTLNWIKTRITRLSNAPCRRHVARASGSGSV